MPDRATRVVEIRTYRLLPGTRNEYDRLFREEALPLLRRFEVDVVAAGPSLDDPNGYFLIRSFADLADREQREEQFYSSPEWREGPAKRSSRRSRSTPMPSSSSMRTTIEALRRSLAR